MTAEESDRSLPYGPANDICLEVLREDINILCKIVSVPSDVQTRPLE
jgi:hypothetical protein